MTIYFPTYNALTMGTQLTQERYDNFICKVALGVAPVDKVDAEGAPLDECWEWTAGKSRGYGQYGFAAGKIGQAHRVSAFLAGLTGVKSQSKNDQVLHKCDNPACQNPKHFFIGSPKDNSDDRDIKGRQAKGEETGNAKLNWEQVREIREQYAAGNTTLQNLASEYGVVKSAICKIIHKEIWLDPNYTPPQTRLSQEQRAEVVALYQQGNTNQQKLAQLHNVSRRTIYSIIHRGT